VNIAVLWTVHSGYNCYLGNGATNIGSRNIVDDINVCKNICLNSQTCTGFVWKESESDRCWLRRDIVLESCERNRGYSTWIINTTVTDEGMMIGNDFSTCLRLVMLFR